MISPIMITRTLLATLLALPLARCRLAAVWSSDIGSGGGGPPVSSLWTLTQRVSIGNVKTKAVVEYDPEVLLSGPKSASLSGAVGEGLGYKAKRDFKAKKTALTLQADVPTGIVSADFSGPTLPSALSKISASASVAAAGGVKIAAEPSLLVKAKTASVKLSAAVAGAALGAEVWPSEQRVTGATASYKVPLSSGRSVGLTVRSSHAGGRSRSPGAVTRVAHPTLQTPTCPPSCLTMTCSPAGPAAAAGPRREVRRLGLRPGRCVDRLRDYRCGELHATPRQRSAMRRRSSRPSPLNRRALSPSRRPSLRAPSPSEEREAQRLSLLCAGCGDMLR